MDPASGHVPSRVTTLTVAPDLVLPLRVWSAREPRATIAIVHGLGEHGGRYSALASDLVAADCTVLALDLSGHGHAEGPRGDLPWLRLRDEALPALGGGDADPGAVGQVPDAERPDGARGPQPGAHGHGGHHHQRLRAEAVDRDARDRPEQDGGDRPREPEDREELLALLHGAYERKLLDADALSMIEGVLQVAELQARDIMFRERGAFVFAGTGGDGEVGGVAGVAFCDAEFVDVAVEILRIND